MAQTKVTSELLRQFSRLLQEERERFMQIKNSMDQTLNGFLWDDPVAHKFKAQYEDDLKPLNEKLLPAMERYGDYLAKEVQLVGDYGTGSGGGSFDSPSLSAFKAAAKDAGVVGVTAAGVGGIAVSAAAMTGNSSRNSPSLSAFKSTAKDTGIIGKATGSDGIKMSESAATKPFAGVKPSISTYDQDIAIEKLQKQAKPAGVKKGDCALYVKQALQAGGIEIGDNEKGHAYVYKDLLPQKGFEKQDIAFKKELIGGNWTYTPNKEIKKGDVVVFDAIPNKKGKEYGHIQMYDGQNWISDFKQTYFNVWGDVNFNEIQYTVFRKI